MMLLIVWTGSSGMGAVVGATVEFKHEIVPELVMHDLRVVSKTITTI